MERHKLIKQIVIVTSFVGVMFCATMLSVNGSTVNKVIQPTRQPTVILMGKPPYKFLSSKYGVKKLLKSINSGSKSEIKHLKRDLHRLERQLDV